MSEVEDTSTLDYSVVLDEITPEGVHVWNVEYFSGTWRGILHADWQEWENSGWQGTPPDTVTCDWKVPGKLYVPPNLIHSKTIQ